MKKLFFTLLMSLVMMSITQAQVVTSVAGLDFGTPKQAAISYLKSHFGTPYEQNGDYIWFCNRKIGSIDFNNLVFYFRNGVFHWALLANTYAPYDKKRCEKEFKYILSKYQSKYTSNYYQDVHNGIDYYHFGKYEDNTEFPIELYHEKQDSQYGPVWLIHVIYGNPDNNEF